VGLIAANALSFLVNVVCAMGIAASDSHIPAPSFDDIGRRAVFADIGE